MDRTVHSEAVPRTRIGASLAPVISAVVFDLDGTLVETEELKASAHACSVMELRPEVPEEDVISAYANDLVGWRKTRG